jgi:hypothetical protein
MTIKVRTLLQIKAIKMTQILQELVKIAELKM